MATYGATSTRSDDYEAEYRGLGWLTFAGVMLGLVGVWNFFDGILALANSKVYGANHTYVFSDLRTWGWLMLLAGALQMLAAFAIFAGSEWARWFGIAVASVNAIAQLSFVAVYPLWGLMMFAADVLVIYGLTVYGGKKMQAT
jgi:predicted membrane metal-binding protein